MFFFLFFSRSSFLFLVSFSYFTVSTVFLMHTSFFLFRILFLESALYIFIFLFPFSPRVSRRVIPRTQPRIPVASQLTKPECGRLDGEEGCLGGVVVGGWKEVEWNHCIRVAPAAYPSFRAVKHMGGWAGKNKKIESGVTREECVGVCVCRYSSLEGHNATVSRLS